jgi:hypothetical protein
VAALKATDFEPERVSAPPDARDGGPDAATDARHEDDGGFTRGPSVVIEPRSGANTVELTQAPGVRLTFDLALSTSALVSHIEIDNRSATGIRLYRVTWTLEDEGQAAVARAADLDVDMQIPARRISPYPKTVVLITNYRAGLRLRVVFGALVTSATTAIVGLPLAVYEECKAPQLFAPAVSRHWNGNAPPCRNCHSGLFSFELMGRDDATACGLNKRLLRPGGPNLLRPTLASHPGGLMPEADAYSAALGAWRRAEE